MGACSCSEAPQAADAAKPEPIAHPAQAQAEPSKAKAKVVAPPSPTSRREAREGRVFRAHGTADFDSIHSSPPPGSERGRPGDIAAGPASARHHREKDGSDLKALESAVDGLSVEELEYSFAAVDLDDSKQIDEAEMAKLLEFLGVTFTSKSLKSVFQSIDADGNGVVSKEEFIQFFMEKSGRRSSVRAVLSEAVQDHVQVPAKGAAIQKDVYIMHGMHSEVLGVRRSWWLAQVLEFSDLTCSGPYVTRTRDGSKGPAQDTRPVELSRCAVVALMLEGNSLITEMVLSQIKAAERANKSIVCFYEAEQDVWEKLKAWREAAPGAFKRAVAISRHFLSDSEQLVLSAVHEMLGSKVPMLRNIRPPGGDFDDFSSLRIDGIKWLKSEYAFSLKQGMTAQDLPGDAFDWPENVRTCFVSYAQEDPNVPGLSASQLTNLRMAVKRNMLGNRLFFLPHLSIDSKSYLLDLDAHDLLSLSRFVILDEASSQAKDKTPYLERGQNYLEAMIAILTGCVAPYRDNQFVELDNAIGLEIGAGTNFRRYVRESASHPYKLVNQLCALLRTKRFASKLDMMCAERLLRRALERHPILAVMAEVGHRPAPTAAKAK